MPKPKIAVSEIHKSNLKKLVDNELEFRKYVSKLLLARLVVCDKGFFDNVKKVCTDLGKVPLQDILAQFLCQNPVDVSKQTKPTHPVENE